MRNTEAEAYLDKFAQLLNDATYKYFLLKKSEKTRLQKNLDNQSYKTAHSYKR